MSLRVWIIIGALSLAYVASSGKPIVSVKTKPGTLASKVISGGECDLNYAGACVPIASDVDCAGGNGNGPAYVKGTVRVIGKDVYGLDRDHDGLGCEPPGQ